MDQCSPIPECARLSLSELRNHRRELEEEENTVSYWRRLIQARVGVLQAGATLTEGDTRSLKRVLAGHHALATRTSRLRLSASDQAPPLPDIAALWARLDDPSDAASRAQLVLDLRRIEQQLTAHRQDLHLRIGAAMAETIARYHANPKLCLSALPAQQRRAG
ncbi:MAG: hypothetical protein DLM59_01730 [Pseudonocardiales bacterium]|nr:MAG: hypothetical protein DLM59_01730 [Pseudonocardiales bacterium]